MSKIDRLIQRYSDDLVNKFKIQPDLDLLKAVIRACGPSIFKRDGSLVAGASKQEVQRIKENFLIKKLGLSDRDGLDEAIERVISEYGKSEKNKFRPVVYYMLADGFHKSNEIKEYGLVSLNSYEQLQQAAKTHGDALQRLVDR